MGVDFVHPDLPFTDIALFGLDGPLPLRVKDWPSLAVEAGVFSGKSEAKRDGWNGEIPSGVSQRKAGKKGIITVLNYFDGDLM